MDYRKEACLETICPEDFKQKKAHFHLSFFFRKLSICLTKNKRIGFSENIFQREEVTHFNMEEKKS